MSSARLVGCVRRLKAQAQVAGLRHIVPWAATASPCKDRKHACRQRSRPQLCSTWSSLQKLQQHHSKRGQHASHLVRLTAPRRATCALRLPGRKGGSRWLGPSIADWRNPAVGLCNHFLAAAQLLCHLAHVGGTGAVHGQGVDEGEVPRAHGAGWHELGVRQVKPGPLVARLGCSQAPQASQKVYIEPGKEWVKWGAALHAVVRMHARWMQGGCDDAIRKVNAQPDHCSWSLCKQYSPAWYMLAVSSRACQT